MVKAVWIVIAVMAAPATAAVGADDFEARILDRLQLSNPEAVPVFREAEKARRAGDARKASELYGRVLELAPDFSHAMRRRCQSEAELGERDKALGHCRRAVAVERSADNLSTLAMVLVNMGEGGDEAAVREALQLSRDAVRADPSSVSAQGVLCQVAMLANEVGALSRCVEQLQRAAPNDVMTHMFAASLAIAQSRWADARKELTRARELGMPDELYSKMHATIGEHEGGVPKWIYAAGGAGALGLLVLVLLLVRRSRKP